MKKTKTDNYKLVYQEIHMIYKELLEIKDCISKIENKIELNDILKLKLKNE